MAVGHGVSAAALGLGKGKSPVAQVPEVLLGVQGGPGILPNASIPSQTASPSTSTHPAMATFRSASGPPGNDGGVGPSVLPPQGPSVAVPPLARAPKDAQAKKRRFMAAQRRPLQQTFDDNTTFSFGNTANTMFNQQPADAWPRPQLNFTQPMASQQRSSRTDEGVSLQPATGGHVASPTLFSLQQQMTFPPVSVHPSSGY